MANYTLSCSKDIINSLRGVPPKQIRRYYVKTDGVAYPIKQALGEALDRKHIGQFRADFTSQHATSVLLSLGFETKRA